MTTSNDDNHPQPTLRDMPHQQKVYHFLVTGAATIVILAGIRAASGIIAPMLLALFLTIILVVPLRWLRAKGCPNILSLLLVIGCTLTIFLGIGLFAGKSLNDFLRQLPAYKDRITRKVDDLDKKLAQYGFVLGSEKKADDAPTEEKDRPPKSQDAPPQKTSVPTPAPQPPTEIPFKPTESAMPPLETAHEPQIPDPEDSSSPRPVDEATMQEMIGDEPIETPEDIEELFVPRKVAKPSLTVLNTNIVMYWVSKSLVELKHLAESGFLVMIITLFMIFEAARFSEKVDIAFGKEGPIRNEHFHHIASEIRRYLVLKTISSAMSGFAATLVYLSFDVPGALLWGLIAFFLYFIPNIGGIAAAIIPGLLIFMGSGPEAVLVYAICLVGVECTIGYGIEPKMLGHGLGISTVVIILSLFFWGWILGPVGLFLAAPLTIMVKIILQAFKETEWIAILLDDGRSMSHMHAFDISEKKA